MQEKTKTQADRQIIKSILNIDPIDWARYPDGTLAFIAPSGKKFKYSLKMVGVLKQDASDSKAAKKAAAKKTSAKKAKKESLPEPEPSSDAAPGAAAK
jgi:hypothetical protein